MRIITESRLTEFWTKHPPAKSPLKVWREIIRRSTFASPHEAKTQFPTADFLGDGLTVFDIGGNKYRLVVTMRYKYQIVYIGHVLTHAEYDRKSRSGDL
ncbi:MAG TPA: type II toxin-antitoxin system HigB family toxin [Longimicrobium sp.]|nr:type II toxin-antitoxin system HigB family toxin [Longimicrobium sp.]